MKQLKKNFLTLSLLIFTMSVSSQTGFDCRVGLNMSTIKGAKIISFTGKEFDMDYCFGPYFGFTIKSFGPKFGFESGLSLAWLGAKKNIKDSGYYHDLGTNVNYEMDVNVDMLYLQVPFNLLYKYNVNDNFSIYPSLGLYLGFGMAGSYKHEGKLVAWGETYPIEKVEDKNLFQGDDAPDYFDIGSSIGIRFAFNFFGKKKDYIGIDYDYSLAKINKDDLTNQRNSVIRLSIGQIF